MPADTPAPSPEPLTMTRETPPLTDADWERIAYFTSAPSTEPRRLLVKMTDALATMTLDRDGLAARLAEVKRERDESIRMHAELVRVIHENEPRWFRGQQSLAAAESQRDRALALVEELIAEFVTLDNKTMMPVEYLRRLKFRARAAAIREGNDG